MVLSHHQGNMPCLKTECITIGLHSNAIRENNNEKIHNISKIPQGFCTGNNKTKTTATTVVDGRHSGLHKWQDKP
jgi:hypothetical protein